ncbi:hypothetical protein [Methylovirgula sp. 4M-Z18]|uniref:hypothetical protein n=1 Tax=Methylovirgula sp. 4M-Z18 TaxID=2293567 RepID=UPI000E2F0820|nr:hypothetical protein [Methylovirgula sp. 4M-Z18]
MTRHPQAPNPYWGNALIVGGGFALWVALLGFAWINGGWRSDGSYLGDRLANGRRPALEHAIGTTPVAAIRDDNALCGLTEAEEARELESDVAKNLAILDGTYSKYVEQSFATVTATPADTVGQLVNGACRTVARDTAVKVE